MGLRVVEAAVKLMYRKILVVEDDYLQASEYRRAFEAQHCIVFGPVSNEQEAVKILEAEVPDFAIVDLNLGNGMSFAVADALVEQEVPFCFATGYECKDIPAEFSTFPCFSKPIDPPHLIATMEKIFA
ncbi:response regulator [Rhizobium bangladeshense]|uniref:response regulator n=2 Tax=Rhizobium bangladeshense TaxID=1138189 RepID=UPI001FD99C2D|nr:response regulator [Rhizobium bangladeshense]